jgi:hypothetical protein
MGQTVRGVNQTQHGIKLRLVPDRHEPPPPATYRPKGGRLWHVPTILNLVLNRLGRHIQPLIQLWNDYATGNLPAQPEPDPRPTSRTEAGSEAATSVEAAAETRRGPNAEPSPSAKPPRQARPEPVPRARGWLEHLCKHTATAYVARCVNAPDMRAFVLAVPQAARHLRPLCTTLQIPIPDYLKLRLQRQAPTEPQPAATPRTGAEASADPPGADMPARASPPCIRKLAPDPRHAHPGWQRYVAITRRLQA